MRLSCISKQRGMETFVYVVLPKADSDCHMGTGGVPRSTHASSAAGLYRRGNWSGFSRESCSLVGQIVPRERGGSACASG